MEFADGADFDADLSKSTVVIRGRLSEHLEFWRSINASQFVIRIIEEGYKLTFVCLPEWKFFGNHVSALENKSFVFEAFEELLSVGSVIEVAHEQVHVCSPLGVVPKKNNKLRLILDLRYVNGFC